jgi:hypothetical protein
MHVWITSRMFMMPPSSTPPPPLSLDTTGLDG